MTSAPQPRGAVAGVLLAAGGGSRFGRPKALVEFGGNLLVERSLGVLADAELSLLVVVLGAAQDEVLRRADVKGADVVSNPEWRSGMGSSLRRGLKAAEGRASAAVITLVDQPLLAAESVRRLVAAWHAGAIVAVATYGEQHGHPILLDASVWSAVAEQATGDVGARRFLREHPELLTSVPCDDAGSPLDIDCPADLDAAAALLPPSSPGGAC